MKSSSPNQSLAMSYGMQKRKKKMAKGGMVNESASSERRPMPMEMDKDSHMVAQQAANGQAPKSFVSEQRMTESNSNGKPSITRIKHPSFVQSPTFKARMRDQEDEIVSTMPPSGYKSQPPSEYNEERPMRQGPSSPSLRMKMYADGGEVEDDMSSASDSAPKEASSDTGMPSSGEDHDSLNSMSAPSEDYKSGTQASAGPSISTPSFGSDAGAAALGGGSSGGGGGGSPLGMLALLADGGEVEDPADKMSDKDDVSCVDRPDTGFGAVICRADGGEIDGDDMPRPKSIAEAIRSRKSSQADIVSNGKESANQMNQRNEAALKENYDSDMEDVSQPMDSNEKGRTIDHDVRDMVSAIRSRMKMRKA